MQIITRKAIATVLAASIALAGCATSSSGITGAYTSPVQYQSYDCAQLVSESQRIQVRVTQLAGRLDEAAKNDKVLMGVGLVLFWPALFALGGTKQEEAEYARLKGEHDAVEQTIIAKKCERSAATTTALQPPAPAPSATPAAPPVAPPAAVAETAAPTDPTNAER